MIAEKVRSGEYQSESDVVVDGLLSLVLDDGPHQADRSMDRDRNGPMLEAIDDADPSLLIPLEEARRQLHAYIDHLDDKIR